MAIRPMPFMMRPRGVGGGGPPMMPGSPIGGPGGPGPSPMVSPGQGLGQKAAATQAIKTCMRNIQIAGLSFDPGSKEFNAVMGALRSLNGVFGKPTDVDTEPSARMRMAQPPPGPLAGAPPAGIAGGPGGGGPGPPMVPGQFGGGDVGGELGTPGGAPGAGGY